MVTLVIAPDAAARFLQDTAILHNAHLPTAPLRTADPNVFSVLLGFLAPANPSDLRRSFPTASWPAFDRLVAALKTAGVLIEPAPTTGPRSPEERAEVLHRQFGLLANAASEIAADLAMMGPAFEPLDRQSGGISLEHRVEALLYGMDGLRQCVLAAHADLLRQQIEKLRARGLLNDLKLHVGAGAGILDGWVNIDAYPADLALNVNRPLPFADRSVRFVYASHVLEHLYYPEAALAFLCESRRVLRPDGRLRMVVPDIEKYLRAYVAGDRKFFEERRKTWRRLPHDRTLLEEFLAYAGAGPSPAAFLDSHKYAYDFDTLRQHLMRAGFQHVRRCSFNASPVEELRVDSASEVAHAATEGRHYSLFVEALPA